MAAPQMKRGAAGTDSPLKPKQTPQADVTTPHSHVDAMRAALLDGKAVRLIDFPSADRPAVIAAIAALRDELPVSARWVTVRESHLSQTRLRAVCYAISGQYLREAGQ